MNPRHDFIFFPLFFVRQPERSPAGGLPGKGWDKTRVFNLLFYVLCKSFVGNRRKIIVPLEIDINFVNFTI
jgi:hypothetical protein